MNARKAQGRPSPGFRPQQPSSASQVSRFSRDAEPAERSARLGAMPTSAWAWEHTEAMPTQTWAWHPSRPALRSADSAPSLNDRYGGRMSAGSNDLIVSVSGIRGIVGAGLTPGAVLAFAQALGTYLGVGPIVLSRDSRPSGD